SASSVPDSLQSQCDGTLSRQLSWIVGETNSSTHPTSNVSSPTVADAVMLVSVLKYFVVSTVPLSGPAIVSEISLSSASVPTSVKLISSRSSPDVIESW